MPKLTRREHVIGWAGIVVLVAIFLPWQSLDPPTGTTHYDTWIDGWKTGIVGWGGAMLLAAAGEYLIARRLGYRLWAPPFGDTWLAVGLCATGLVLVLVRWATLPPTLLGITTGSSYGLWIAVAAGVVETVAAVDEARGGGRP